MKKLTTILAIAAAGLALGGCGESQEPVEVMATETITHTVPPTSSSISAAPPAPAEGTGANIQGASFKPGDPRLVSVDSIGTVGMFMDPDIGMYYVCNGGELTAAQGSPVESGTCAGPYSDYYAAGELTSRLSRAVGGAIEQEFVNEGLLAPEDLAEEPAPVDEGEITEHFWDCMEAGGTEETCLQ